MTVGRSILCTLCTTTALSCFVHAQVPASTAPFTVAPRPPHEIALEASEAGVTLTLRAPTDIVEVGTELPFTLTISSEATVAVTNPTVTGEHGPFELREIERSARRDDERRVVTLRFAATTYLSGQLELAALPVEFKGTDGVTSTLAVGPVPIEVISLVGAEFDPSVFRDIKGPVAIDFGHWWWWIAGGVGIVALIALITSWIRRGKAANERLLTACEWANRELEQLARDRLIERGDVHRFWVRLSGTVREYVERQFNIAAPDQTTQEFLSNAATHAQIDQAHRATLERFLRAADRVKFAAHRPQHEECRAGLESARTFVQETTPAKASEARSNEFTGAGVH